MALDYKTLQATAASQPQHAAGYCPECGRPWMDSSSESARGVSSFPWRSALLAALGLFLAIVFGLQAASAFRTQAEIQRALADPAATLLCSSVDGHCDPADQQGEWLIGQFDRYDVARRRLRAALVATALGLLAFLAGLGATARRALAHRGGGPGRGTSPGARGPARHLAAGFGALAEMTAFGLFQLLALAGGYVAASRVVRGEPPSVDLLAHAVAQVAGAVLMALQGL
jgi:hypothetical protein